MPRGGRRQGRPGQAYAQRSDLNTALPVQAATGQAYGERGAQVAAQRALPMGRPATDAVQPTPSPGAVRSRPASPPLPVPGQLTSLDAPSQRPGEPVTAGLAVGPGAGPEALGPFAEKRDGAEDLALYLPMLEFMASQPGASSQTRNFVRRLRGAAATPRLGA